MQVIDPTSLLQFKKGDIDLENLMKSFQVSMKEIKDSDDPIL